MPDNCLYNPPPLVILMITLMKDSQWCLEKQPFADVLLQNRLKISQNSQANTCVEGLFLIKLLCLKETFNTGVCL